MTLVWHRLSSGNRVLMGAGASAMVVAGVGASVGRSPALCSAFVIVGLALLAASTFAPRAIAVEAVATVATAPTDVVVDEDVRPVRATPRARRKLLSAVSLLFLLAFSILVLALVFVAFCVATFLILSGH